MSAGPRHRHTWSQSRAPTGAFASVQRLALPAQVICSEECAGRCAVCGANLNHAGEEHAHERAPDPRWAKLRELRLD